MDENLLLDCLNTLSKVIQTVNKPCKFFSVSYHSAENDNKPFKKCSNRKLLVPATLFPLMNCYYAEYFILLCEI